MENTPQRNLHRFQRTNVLTGQPEVGFAIKTAADERSADVWYAADAVPDAKIVLRDLGIGDADADAVLAELGNPAV